MRKSIQLFILINLGILLPVFGSQFTDIIADENKQFSLTLNSVPENGIFHKSEFAEVYAVVRNDSLLNIEGIITWKIETDEHEVLKEYEHPFKISAGSNKSVFCPLYEFPVPGFYSFECTIRASGQILESKRFVVGYKPEKITSEITRKDDFGDFWENSINELKNINPKYKLTKNEEKSTADINLYFVEMQSLDNVKVTGWLEVPVKPGKYPAVLKVPGYLTNMKPYLDQKNKVILSFNPRGHGDSEQGSDAHLDLWLRGLDNHNTYFYKGAYLDCLRALDFLANRQEVDETKIAVWGGSQGGGFSFMLASLDERVDLCIADIPWLCDWKRYFKTSHWDEIDAWILDKPERNWSKMLTTLGYFDTMNMAEKIKCPVLMSIGLQDPVCPPSTSFATYNNIDSEKEYIIYPRAQHYTGDEHWKYVYKWIDQKFNLEK